MDIHKSISFKRYNFRDKHLTLVDLLRHRDMDLASACTSKWKIESDTLIFEEEKIFATGSNWTLSGT